jgi:hypothetical protein
MFDSSPGGELMAKSPTFTTDVDRHLVFNASQPNLKCYRRDGTLEWYMEAHGEGTGGDSSLPNGNTPPACTSSAALNKRRAMIVMGRTQSNLIPSNWTKVEHATGYISMAEDLGSRNHLLLSKDGGTPMVVLEFKMINSGQ